MKVDFLIGGTQKGGTTALDRYLRDHPEVCMATRKELHFFDRDKYFQHATVDYASYHQCFRSCERRQLLGEATPIYMYWNDAPRRVWEYNPEMKWIILLRNPIERAYSHWYMERCRKRDTFDFWEAIRDEHIRCREAFPFQHRVYSYVDRGFYTEQLRRIWSFFPRRQTLVLKSEALRADPTPVLNTVYNFLGVSSVSSVDAVTGNAQDYVVPMGAREKAHLVRVYEREIEQLETLLDWSCRDWLA